MYGLDAASFAADLERSVAAIEAAAPELVLGTQMERHIAKRLGIGCAVISTPAHVQDYPARYSPQMGFEGANVIFDSWVHPLMMGLEEHLLTMFREDFEFHDEAGQSHHGGHAPKPMEGGQPPAPAEPPRSLDGKMKDAVGRHYDEVNATLARYRPEDPVILSPELLRGRGFARLPRTRDEHRRSLVHSVPQGVSQRALDPHTLIVGLITAAF